MDTRIEIGPDDRVATLVDRAPAGGTVTLTRGGQPVAELRALPVAANPPPFDAAALARFREMTKDLPPQPHLDGAKTIREMRDEGL